MEDGTMRGEKTQSKQKFFWIVYKKKRTERLDDFFVMSTAALGNLRTQ